MTGSTQRDPKNRFALFKNDRPQNERSPHWNGTLTDANGKEWWINAWEEKDRNGSLYFSGTLREKEDRPDQGRGQNQGQGGGYGGQNSGNQGRGGYGGQNSGYGGQNRGGTRADERKRPPDDDDQIPF